MPLILHIETATPVCSTSLSRDGVLVDFRETNDPRSHASRLSPYIQDLMSSNNLKYSDLDAVALSMGPGSYTGLRIGASTAKGIAYGADIPIIGISTLKALANRFISINPELKKQDNILLCPMLDARRMEVYSAFYKPSLDSIREVKADIIEPDSYIEFLESNIVHFFGDGSDKCQEVLTHKNVRFTPGIELSSRFMPELAEALWEAKDFLDTAYFEPFYLKDFIATIPKNKVLPPQKTDS